MTWLVKKYTSSLAYSWKCMMNGSREREDQSYRASNGRPASYTFSLSLFLTFSLLFFTVDSKAIVQSCSLVIVFPLLRQAASSLLKVFLWSEFDKVNLSNSFICIGIAVGRQASIFRTRSAFPLNLHNSVAARWWSWKSSLSSLPPVRYPSLAEINELSLLRSRVWEVALMTKPSTKPLKNQQVGQSLEWK